MSYQAVMVRENVWVDVSETILNLDPMLPDPIKIAYLQGLISSQVDIEKEEVESE